MNGKLITGLMLVLAAVLGGAGVYLLFQDEAPSNSKDRRPVAEASDADAGQAGDTSSATGAGEREQANAGPSRTGDVTATNNNGQGGTAESGNPRRAPIIQDSTDPVNPNRPGPRPGVRPPSVPDRNPTETHDGSANDRVPVDGEETHGNTGSADGTDGRAPDQPYRGPEAPAGAQTPTSEGSRVTVPGGTQVQPGNPIERSGGTTTTPNPGTPDVPRPNPGAPDAPRPAAGEQPRPAPGGNNNNPATPAPASDPRLTAATKVRLAVPAETLIAVNHSVVLDVAFTSPASVKSSGISFQLTFPSSCLTYIRAEKIDFGGVAKDLAVSETGNGSLMVVCFGINQDEIPSGAKIRFTFSVTRNMEAGWSGDFGILNSSATNPEAKRNEVEALSGKVRFGS